MFIALVACMAAVVVLSNILVQYNINAEFGRFDLAVLTYGALTYPFAFLVTDIANRALGVARARQIVLVGFALAVVMSTYLATPRIALASGTAFLVAQLCDAQIFHKLRKRQWWQAPAISSTFGSMLDTFLFFSLAFSATASLGFEPQGWATNTSNLLGVFSVQAPFWWSMALADFLVKLAYAALLLLPYHITIKKLVPQSGAMNTKLAGG